MWGDLDQAGPSSESLGWDRYFQTFRDKGNIFLEL